MNTTQDKILMFLSGALFAYSSIALTFSIRDLIRYYARKRLSDLQEKHISALLGVASPETAKYLAEKDKNARF